MKLKNILWAGFSALALVSCDDYLDVDAPSQYDEEFIFTQESEIARALNGVYAQALVGDLYGNAYQNTFVYNSDVDMQVNASASASDDAYARFDCNSLGGGIEKYWNASFRLIEYANRFIRGVENSSFYEDANPAVMQQLGEAKCLRAMAYHDLVVMFGDVPFVFHPAADKGSDYIPPVVDRLVVQDSIIKDLQRIIPFMSSSKDVTVEKCSKEFAHALVARIALTAGGYSLRPNLEDERSYGVMERPENYKDYYQIAMQHADSVIRSGSHKLTMDYQDVFVKPCNYEVVNGDDVIFELPFAKLSTGNTGYIQGPTYSSYEGETVGPWGEAKGNGRLSAFYRFLFRDGDLRREFVNGLWYYTYNQSSGGQLKDSVVIRNDYTVHNNKWSKLWTANGNELGSKTSGSTGINYPYMRYADVLLMYAEASNEVNEGPKDLQAVECLQQVHNRAFVDGDVDFVNQAVSGGKETFLKAVLDERKWEFAGENSRWRDLVRTNTYSQELVYSFLRYYSAASQAVMGFIGYEDAINEHDGKEYIDRLPTTIHYHQYNLSELANMNPNLMPAVGYQLYGYQVEGNAIVKNYPNQSLKSLRIYNAYSSAPKPPTKGVITLFGFVAENWLKESFYNWGDANTGLPKDQCLNSFYGFIRADKNGNIWLVRNGALDRLPTTIPSVEELPVVRYILPYPEEVLKNSMGVYKNYYGY